MNQAFGRRLAQGFTLVEAAVVIAIIAIFASFAWINFNTIDEDADGAMAQSTQASLQTVLLQGADRLNTSAANVLMSQVVAATPGLTGRPDQFSVTATSATQVTLALPRSGRSVVYRSNACGQVCVNAMNGFSKYNLRPNPTGCDADPVPCQVMHHL